MYPQERQTTSQDQKRFQRNQRDFFSLFKSITSQKLPQLEKQDEDNGLFSGSYKYSWRNEVCVEGTSQAMIKDQQHHASLTTMKSGEFNELLNTNQKIHTDKHGNRLALAKISQESLIPSISENRYLLCNEDSYQQGQEQLDSIKIQDAKPSNMSKIQLKQTDYSSTQLNNREKSLMFSQNQIMNQDDVHQVQKNTDKIQNFCMDSVFNQYPFHMPQRNFESQEKDRNLMEENARKQKIQRVLNIKKDTDETIIASENNLKREEEGFNNSKLSQLIFQLENTVFSKFEQQQAQLDIILKQLQSITSNSPNIQNDNTENSNNKSKEKAQEMPQPLQNTANNIFSSTNSTTLISQQKNEILPNLSINLNGGLFGTTAQTQSTTLTDRMLDNKLVENDKQINSNSISQCGLFGFMNNKEQQQPKEESFRDGQAQSGFISLFTNNLNTNNNNSNKNNDNTCITDTQQTIQQSLNTSNQSQLFAQYPTNLQEPLNTSLIKVNEHCLVNSYCQGKDKCPTEQRLDFTLKYIQKQKLERALKYQAYQIQKPLNTYIIKFDKQYFVNSYCQDKDKCLTELRLDQKNMKIQKLKIEDALRPVQQDNLQNKEKDVSYFGNEATQNSYQIQTPSNKTLLGPNINAYVNSKSNGEYYCLTELRLQEGSKSGKLYLNYAFEPLQNPLKQTESKTSSISLLGNIFNQGTINNTPSTSGGGLLSSTNSPKFIHGGQFTSSGGLYGKTIHSAGQSTSLGGGDLFGHLSNQGAMLGQPTNQGQLFGQPTFQGNILQQQSSQVGLLGQNSVQLGLSNNQGGLFGQSSMFGQQTTSSGGIIGQATSQGGIIGSGSMLGQSSTSVGGGLFGNPSSSGITLGQATSQGGITGGGMFGKPTSSVSGGLFGNPSSSGVILGQATSQGGIIGSGSMFCQSSSSVCGGLFGNPSSSGVTLGQATSQGGITGGGMFGKPTNSVGGGLFGNPTISGGIFGQPINQGSQLGQSISQGGTFSQLTGQGGGMFGQQTSNIGLLGQSISQGGIFGSNTETPFGQNSTQVGQESNKGGLFGSQKIQQVGGGIFGNQKFSTN